jgi:hypothetical protein
MGSGFGASTIYQLNCYKEGESQEAKGNACFKERDSPGLLHAWHPEHVYVHKYKRER